MLIWYGVIAFNLGLLILGVKGFPLLDPTQIIALLIAGMFLIFYLIPYFEALKSDETSRVVPLFQFIPIFVAIMSVIFLNEKLRFPQLLGFGFVFLGAISLSSNKIDFKILRPRRSFWLMIIASFLYAVVLIIFRAVVRVEDFWITIGYEYLGMGLAILVTLLSPKVRDTVRNEFKPTMKLIPFFVLNNSLTVIAQTSEAFAISLAPVTLVSMVTSTQPIFVFLYGVLITLFLPHLLSEDIRAKTLQYKALSLVSILIGLALVYFN